jgi:hypothetical protein
VTVDVIFLILILDYFCQDVVNLEGTDLLLASNINTTNLNNPKIAVLDVASLLGVINVNVLQ